MDLEKITELLDNITTLYSYLNRRLDLQSDEISLFETTIDTLLELFEEEGYGTVNAYLKNMGVNVSSGIKNKIHLYCKEACKAASLQIVDFDRVSGPYDTLYPKHIIREWVEHIFKKL